MGLLAVIGPSMNDQVRLPLFFSTSFLKASVSRQNSKMECSIAVKSGLLSTGLNAIYPPFEVGRRKSEGGDKRFSFFRLPPSDFRLQPSVLTASPTRLSGA